MNNPLISYYIRERLKRFKVDNCWYQKSIIHKDARNICFLLDNDTYIHFGDILFLIPLIIYVSNHYNVYVKTSPTNQNFIRHFLKNKANIVFDKGKLNKNETINIVHPYCFFNYSEDNIVGLGLPMQKITCSYPKYLTSIATKYLKIQFDEKLYKRTLENIVSDEQDKEFNDRILNPSLLVSPYVSSGKFRDLFGFKRRKILSLSKEIMLKKKYYSTVLVGSGNDKCNNDDYVNKIDIRGLDIVDAMTVVRNPLVVEGVGFDNFWMHYFHLIKKPYKIIFRGRFTKLHYHNHINFINTSFLGHD